MPINNIDFTVNKTDLSQTRFVETTLADASELAGNQALLKVDTFSFTANNFTYAVTGESFGYWDFFPASDGFGRIPVWGFADVLGSNVEGLAVGDRLYGYLPMSTHLVIEPGKMTKHGLMDLADHRQKRAPIYNHYSFTKSDPTYRPDHEALISLFRPLFSTAFLLDDYLADGDFFCAEQVILTSASSKTSMALASLVAKREGIQVIGLTSPSNRKFVEGLGCYDEVVTYDKVTNLNPRPSCMVDMAGNANVISELHHHLGDKAKNTRLVGVTHWDTRARLPKDLPGSKPELFFAPGYAQQRSKEWGGDGLAKRIAQSWVSFAEVGSNWLRIVESHGNDSVSEIYHKTRLNQISPTEGHILSLCDQ